MIRILYISSGGLQDYLCDMILHGLRTSPGVEVVDVQKLWHLYDSADRTALREIHGLGFTLYGRLPDDPSIDRTDIPAKIAARHFDLVIFGSIRRCDVYLDLVAEHYRRPDILLLDGEDSDDYIPALHTIGIYFKRELAANLRFVYPIQFSIPEDRICEEETVRDKVLATVDPRDRSTYIFDREEDYYADYQRSYFAVTTKKGGWDAMRHYEIIAQGAVPWFPDLARCPPLTLNWLPKGEILRALTIFNKGVPERLNEVELKLWSHLQKTIRRRLRERLTTRAMADYVLRVRAQIKGAPDLF